MAKRFKWRFETVEKAKQREKEQRQQALASSRQTLQAEEGVLAELMALRSEQRKLQEQQRIGRLNTDALSQMHTYLENLGQKIKRQQAVVERARKSEQSKQQALVETVREEKVLANLKERDRTEFRKQERRHDQGQTDEVANRRAWPGRPAAGE